MSVFNLRWRFRRLKVCKVEISLNNVEVFVRKESSGPMCEVVWPFGLCLRADFTPRCFFFHSCTDDAVAVEGILIH